MSWAIGYDDTWRRDIGYGVPAYCDHPGCTEEIDRGLSYVCWRQEPYGGETGCGRFYCEEHVAVEFDEFDEARCAHPNDNHISADHPDWIRHKLTDPTWHQWCVENPDEAKRLKEALMKQDNIPYKHSDNYCIFYDEPLNQR